MPCALGSPCTARPGAPWRHRAQASGLRALACAAAALAFLALAAATPTPGAAQTPANIGDVLRELSPAGRVATLSTLLRSFGRSRPDKIAPLFLKSPEILPQKLSRKGGVEADRLIWADFFAGALIDIGNEGGRKPVVGYYNPVLEVWLITQWDASLPVPKVEAAFLATTGPLADPDAGFSSVQTAPDWVANWRGVGIIPAIQQQTARASATFKRLFPPGGTDERAISVPYAVARVTQSTLATRAAIMAASVDKALSSPVRDTAASQVLHAVRKGDAAALTEAAGGGGPDVLVAEVLRLPAETRAGMVIAAAVNNGENYLLLAPAAATPRTVGLIQFRDSADGPVLTALAAFDALGEDQR